MIDIPAQAIWIHRSPENGTHTTRLQLTAPFRIHPVMLDGVELDLSALTNPDCT